MSGHSKWSTIKRKKGKEDDKRGKIFSRLAREIIVAARAGGGDPEMNARLRVAIQAARAANMPADNITRAIKRGTGELEGATFEELIYEAYGPAGVAICIEVMTDNKNRTTPEMRHLLERHGGTMADKGAVMWKFERKGIVQVPKDKITEDGLMEIVLDAGAEDIKTGEDTFEVYTAPEVLPAVADALAAKKVDVASAEVLLVPKAPLTLDAKTAAKVLKLMDAVEEHDDVQKVFGDFDIPHEILEALAAEV